MVELGVRTAHFGPDFKLVNGSNGPLPKPPAPFFPGVSATKFNEVSSLKVYRQTLAKESMLRSGHPGQQGPEALILPPTHALSGHVHDVMPGYSSICGSYKRLGWRPQSATGRLVAPPKEPPELPRGGEFGDLAQSVRRCMQSRGSSPSRRRTGTASTCLSRGASEPLMAAATRAVNVQKTDVNSADANALIRQRCWRPGKTFHIC
mmetsp:Transcript_80784/g.224828  ORF Transcript_80784/g.224828 Transcript_80784/m.224828 type:complete len:206 (-) Transcript_80784:95-712(-)